MKMEMAVHAEHAGEVVELHCAIGRAIGAGATLLVLRPDNVLGAT
jgi:biotin carboxyl carrier protein